MQIANVRNIHAKHLNNNDGKHLARPLPIHATALRTEQHAPPSLQLWYSWVARALQQRIGTERAANGAPMLVLVAAATFLFCVEVRAQCKIWIVGTLGLKRSTTAIHSVNCKLLSESRGKCLDAC